MRLFVRIFALAAMAGQLLIGGELPIEMQAKFIALLCKSANSAGKIVVNDSAMKGELVKVNVSADGDASVAWAASDADVKAMKAAKKLVICGKLEQLQLGGSVAIVEEGGKPQIYLHMANVAASGVTLADTILKIGKKL